jgi:FkbM family methyltransferase
VGDGRAEVVKSTQSLDIMCAGSESPVIGLTERSERPKIATKSISLAHHLRTLAHIINRLRLAGRDTFERTGYTVRKRSGLDLWHDVADALGHPETPTVFDVGANRGQTIWQIRRTFPNAGITAFEPSPRAFPELREHYGGDSRVRLEQLAVGDQAGTLPLHLDSIHCANDSLLAARWHDATTPTVEVPVVTIDEYCAGRSIVQRPPTTRIDVLKIDAQGYDLKVISGAAGMLRRKEVRVLVAEVNVGLLYDGQPTMPELLRALDVFGYVLHGVYNQTHVNGSLLCLDLCWCADSNATMRSG